MGQSPIQPSKIMQQQQPPTLTSIGEQIRDGKLRNIIVMVGAGASTSVGIPDFRTPGSGLYSNLEKYNLPTPESIFTLSYFREHPQAFFTLAKELFPGKFKPSDAHRFIKMLADKDILLRCYTQNIDDLEAIAGVPHNLIMQAHGGFHNISCIDCKQIQDAERFKESCLEGKIYRCVSCNGLTKPDIVFFGEALPGDFGYCVSKDFHKCDCLIIMGTSLTVHPFADLVNMVPPEAKRILINREVCGGNSFLFGKKENTRDLFMQTDCDQGANALAAIILQPSITLTEK